VILVPRKFVYDFYYHLTRQKDGRVWPLRTGRLTSEFGTFKRFDVTSEEHDKKTVIEDAPGKSPTKKPPQKP
jgi:hypothetical protein